MNPTQYTFDAPVVIPKSLWTKGRCYLDVETQNGLPTLLWRPLQDWPEVRNPETGQRGWIVKSLLNDIRSLPHFGKVTLTFEQMLVFESLPTANWDVEKWQLVDASAKSVKSPQRNISAVRKAACSPMAKIIKRRCPSCSNDHTICQVGFLAFGEGAWYAYECPLTGAQNLFITMDSDTYVEVGDCSKDCTLASPIVPFENLEVCPPPPNNSSPLSTR